MDAARCRAASLEGITTPLDGGTRVVLLAGYASAEDQRRRVEDFGAVEGSRQLPERLEQQAGS